MWSTDSGDTWSDPVVIDPLAGAAPFDPDPDGAPCPEPLGNKNSPYICRLRTADGIADIAIDMNDGTAYVVWQDGGPNGNVGIRLAKSTDHGQSWTKLGVVNTVPSTDATPRRWKSRRGRRGELLRLPLQRGELERWARDGALDPPLGDGGASFGPDEILGTTFDTRRAPYALGYFLGDYDGLASIGASFEPFWISTQGSTAAKPVLDGGVDFADRTNVFSAFVP